MKNMFLRSTSLVLMSFMLLVLAFVISENSLAQEKKLIPEPLGMPPVPVPSDNPMTEAKVELGKMLYFDPRLSGDGTVSCSSCHLPEHAYAEPKPVSQGIDNHTGPRNANPVINSAYATSMFWDGRAKDLESQASGPIENPIEMGGKMSIVVEKINAIDEYKKRFQEVFGEPGSKETITKAIAAFERTIISGNSPYDKYQNGDKSAMSEEAIAGMKLFNGKALCASCHTPPVFSNWSFYNAGIGSDKEDPDVGRMEVTGNASDKGAFRVPHLREAADSWPYFHDGSVEKLEDAVRIMATGGVDNPNLHALFRAVKAQNLTDEEINQLVEFVKALSGEYPVIEKPDLPE